MQISILELLQISPNHQAILEKSLQSTTIPTNLDSNNFQEMLGYLTNFHHATFTKQDYSTKKIGHNDPLHREVLVHKTKVRRVLVDRGAE